MFQLKNSGDIEIWRSINNPREFYGAGGLVIGLFGVCYSIHRGEHFSRFYAIHLSELSNSIQWGNRQLDELNIKVLDAEKGT
jgi:hypothetical protein